jgi:hypothetical protein
VEVDAAIPVRTARRHPVVVAVDVEPDEVRPSVRVVLERHADVEDGRGTSA